MKYNNFLNGVPTIRLSHFLANKKEAATENTQSAPAKSTRQVVLDNFEH